MDRGSSHLVDLRRFGLGDGRSPVAQKGAAGLAGVAAVGAAAAAGKVLLERRSAQREEQGRRAFRLRVDERVPDGVRRMADAQIEIALEQLGRGPESPEAIHNARKALKRLRALLRVARGDLDPLTYRRENGAFRNVAQSLTAARESEVMVETLDALAGRFPDELPAEPLERFRLRLIAERDEARAQVPVDVAIQPLKDARARVPAWAFAHDDFRALAPGLQRVHRRARRAARRVESEPSTDNLHDLRKRSKDLWYATRIVRSAAPGRARSIGSAAHDVSDLLGDDRDLALLRTRVLRHRREIADPAVRTALTALIDRRRAQLQREALRPTRRLEATKPAAFVRRVDRRWRKRAAPALS